MRQNSWPMCIALLALVCSTVRAQQASKGVPELRVYKMGFALGEDIKFYLGLKGLTDKQIDALSDSGVVGHLEITTPDGKIMRREVTATAQFTSEPHVPTTKIKL